MALSGTALRTLAPALVWALLATEPAMPARATAPTDGQSAYDAGNYAAARRIWTALAAQGDAKAEFRLGLLYDLGQGVRQDATKAYAWYRRAAEAGLADAQLDVAVMLDSGVGVSPDPAAAALWYARAAAQGQHRAQFDLAQLYADGEGVPHNPAEAAAWYRAAAAGGLPAAAGKLADLRRAAPVAADGVGTVLLPPVPVAPAGPMAARAAEEVPIALVWTAPAEAAPVSFYTEIVPLGAGPLHEAASGYTDVSARPVSLPPGRYAWRVFAVGKSDPHYAASAWVRFAIGDGGAAKDRR